MRACNTVLCSFGNGDLIAKKGYLRTITVTVCWRHHSHGVATGFCMVKIIVIAKQCCYFCKHYVGIRSYS